MKEKLGETDLYVVYHQGPDGNERPFFAKGETWESKFTSNLLNAWKTWNSFAAEEVAASMNESAKNAGHLLAGKIKIGKLCVKELASDEA